MLPVCIRNYIKIASETKILNFGYITTRYYTFTSARMWGTVVIFRSQEGSESKTVWETII